MANRHGSYEISLLFFFRLLQNNTPIHRPKQTQCRKIPLLFLLDACEQLLVSLLFSFSLGREAEGQPHAPAEPSRPNQLQVSSSFRASFISLPLPFRFLPSIGPTRPLVLVASLKAERHQALQQSQLLQLDANLTTVADSIEPEMQKWLRRALFPVLTNVAVDAFDDPQAFEVYPRKLPDLLIECPLIVSGRYMGKFPSTVKVKGRSADMNEVVVSLKIEHCTDIPIEKAFVKQEIDLITAQAWFFESKQLEERVAKLSIQWGIPSEYTIMIFRIEGVEQDKKHDGRRHNRAKDEAVRVVDHVTLGFGNQIATIENLPLGCEDTNESSTLTVLEKTVSCCNGFCDCFCCACCIKTCSKMSDQCMITLAQLCTALSCFACSECCAEVCCDSG